MKSLKKSVLVFVVLLMNGAIFAQENWSAELRPGINFATQDLGNAELKTGFGFEATIGYRFMPHLGAYVGWGWNQFKSDNASFAGTGDTDFEETGYTFGLQFVHPLGKAPKFHTI